ncbi:GPI-anchor transamidase component GPAA1-like [Babylonia areolata]|uniref:GPI-anchor transamidase component GPAA1-like n=1 Tax=Babylonia areolata TaxID=304850 RepID=UPI003FD0F7FC
MGLLTNTKQRQALMQGIVKYHQKLSVLFYIVGVVWFLALAHRPLNAGTYFSENALLPGLVESDLPHGFPSLSSYMQLLKAEMNKDKKIVPKAWIFKEFQNLGLDTYRHNFTIKYPFKMAISQDLHGENIFAILRARRAASTEALVMTAPLRSASHQKTKTDGSVALMLALAAQFRNNPYWAKDVIFLLTEFEEIGVHAWLDAYHETKTPYVIADDLPGRSGAIQAAINLELPSDKIRYLNMKLEGLNGQLPNLDLFNLAIRLSRRERVPATLHHQRDPPDQETLEGYQHMLGTMLRMMWSQASGAPSGNHGLFHRFHIEALTVEGVSKPRGHRSYPLEQIARVVEGIFRSLNNLLERFHQSFFFYLLPSTDRYISIGIYMPPFGLIATAGVIKALALWIITHSSEEEKTDPTADGKKEETGSCDELQDKKEKSVDEGEEDTTAEDDAKTEEDSGTVEGQGPLKGGGDQAESPLGKEMTQEEGKGDAAEELIGEDSDLDDEDFEPVATTGLLSVLPTLMMAYLLGLMAYTAPYVLTHFTPAIKMKAADTILYGILAIFSAGLAYPYLMNRKASPDEVIHSDWQLLKCVGLIVQGLTLFAVSLMNISLAFFLAAVSVPVTMMVKPTRSIILRTLQQVALLLVSPMGLLMVAAVINTAWRNPDDHWYLVAWWSIDEVKQMLFLLLVDQYLFYSWTYTLASFAFLPTWLIFWALPFCQL